MKSKKTQSNTASTTSATVTSHHDEVAKRAYQLFEQNGRQEGRDLEYWLEAEKSLTASRMVEPLSPMEYAESHQPHGGSEQHAQDNFRKNSATREEIRQITSHVRSAPRQSQRPQERGV